MRVESVHNTTSLTRLFQLLPVAIKISQENVIRNYFAFHVSRFTFSVPYVVSPK